MTFKAQTLYNIPRVTFFVWLNKSKCNYHNIISHVHVNLLQAWIDCLVVEQLHHPFNGLRRSLIQNWKQWEEYFSHPIILMNPVPGNSLQELSIFQKCILWKICRPDRVSCQAFIQILT